jgi:hypothetical protein
MVPSGPFVPSPAAPSLIVPPLIETLPVNVLFPESVSAPEPSLVIAVVPEKTTLIE